MAHAEIGELERADPDCTSETAVELLYRVQVSGWLTVSPDRQWVTRSGGDRDRAAFVAGLRLKTAF